MHTEIFRGPPVERLEVRVPCLFSVVDFSRVRSPPNPKRGNPAPKKKRRERAPIAGGLRFPQLHTFEARLCESHVETP